MSSQAFGRYAGYIQDFIYSSGWQSLHPVQEAACEAILDSEDHVLICSDTASGKTEAAFFPLLTLLDHNPPASAGILYISPLKALINDQSRRLERLLEEQRIPVVEWHGDASVTRRQKLLQKKQGIVQITPESLEALLITRPLEARDLFRALPFVVIDEVHAFIGTERGLQLQNLLVRLERLIGHSLRRIALSATLSSFDQACAWLTEGTRRQARVVSAGSSGRRIQVAQEHFVLDPAADENPSAKEPFYNFLYEQVHQRKTLIFCNSRSMCEEVIQALRRLAAFHHTPQHYYIHHGSLSARVRHEAEKAMREAAGPAVTACTLTLELGIDLGDLDLIVEIGAPWSVSSLVQRLGRSGRRTGCSRLLMITLEEQKENRSPVFDFPWEMLRGAAELDLYLKERWIEPFEEIPKPASLLFQQTLAVLAQHNGLSVPALAREVMTLPGFTGRFSLDEYRILLKHMLQEEFRLQTEDGSLLPGEKGDRLLASYKFYAVFRESSEWMVRHGTETIGTLDDMPSVGIPFLLGGRVWVAIRLDEERKTVDVEKAPAGETPLWRGTLQASVDEQILLRMRQLLLSEEKPLWMRPSALARLQEARELAQALQLDRLSILPGNDSVNLVLWMSGRMVSSIQDLLLNGLRNVLQIRSVYASGPVLQIYTKLTAEEFLEQMALNWPQKGQVQPEQVLPFAHKVPRRQKYDAMLPLEEARRWFVDNWIRLPDIIHLLQMLQDPSLQQEN